MNNVIKRVWNQNKMVTIEDLKGMTFQAESGGHTFQISGVDDAGNVIALSGSVAGVFLRPDNTDVAITGSASGGVVSVTLPANCYDVPGRFGLTVFVTANGQKTAVYAAIGTVSRTSSGTVSPGTTSDVVDLINRINAAVATIPASWTGLMADIAPTYSDAAVYPVGAYVYYNGDLYRCTTAITTAESWTAGHWTQAVLGNDVSDLKSAFNTIDDALYGNGFGHLPYDAFAVGRWSADGATWKTDVTNRVATKGLLTASFDMTFIIADGFQAYFWIYSGGSYTGSDWQTGSYSVSSGSMYKVMIGRVTEISETANIQDFVNKLIIPYTIQLEDKSKEESLYLSQLANVGLDNHTADATRVSMYGDLALPYSPVTIKVKIPANMKTQIKFYNISRTENKDTGVMYDGASTSSKAASVFYKVAFRYKVNGNISVSDVETMIANGTIKFTYERTYNPVGNNSESIKNAVATGVKMGSSNSRTQKSLPTFLHISDIHGDATRLENAYKIAQELGVTGLLNTGDSAVYSYTGSCCAFPVDIAKKYSVPTLVSIGNHDARGAASDAELYNMFVKYFDEQYNYVTEDKPYFYKDFADEKLRIISLNLYDGGRSSNSSNCTISQTQIDWLISTLNSVPSNYGVILMYHAVESSYAELTGVSSEWKQSYYREWLDQSSGITGYPIINIIDAYIAKSTYSGTYTQKASSSATAETIAVSADFTNAEGEFICHVCGHDHMDVIGYYSRATHRQLVLMITCGCCFYGSGSSNAFADNSDLPRSYGMTQDAVNVYGIDMASGTVKIARVGADKNADFVVRDVLIAPYK